MNNNTNQQIRSPGVTTMSCENDTLFRQRFQTYLKLRAGELAETTAGEPADIDDVARQVVFTPVQSPWQILNKLDVLQHALDLGGKWADQRETAYLGAIRADIVRMI